jgi:ribonuclease P protein component
MCPQGSPQLWKGCRTSHAMRGSGCGFLAFEKVVRRLPWAGSSILDRTRRLGGLVFPELDEANFPAECTPAKASAWVSRPHGEPRRPRHSQAAPRQGTQASLRLIGAVMKRRNRLSRSRDFDAVYRQGWSTSTRYLVLYSFPREETDDEGPRLGLAVSRQLGGAVERNRLKRRLRAAFDELSEGLSEDVDYVLIARPGLGEAVEAHGFPWLVERVGEVFRKEQS